jgi:hypothetical protein
MKFEHGIFSFHGEHGSFAASKARLSAKFAAQERMVSHPAAAALPASGMFAGGNGGAPSANPGPPRLGEHIDRFFAVFWIGRKAAGVF